MDNQFLKSFFRLLVLFLLVIGFGGAVHRYYAHQVGAPGVVARSMQYASRWDGLARSPDPRDQARYHSILDRSEALYGQVIRRHPDLAVEYRTVEDDRNGFLKWVAFTEKYPTSDAVFPLSGKLDGYTQQRTPWDRAEAKRWLSQHRAAVDEIQAIGLLPEQSMKEIGIDRWSLQSDRLARRCADALLIVSRIAAEQGNEEAALAAAQAAMGLADHLDQIETPSLQLATVAILIRNETHQGVVREVIPALPGGQFHPERWEPLLKAHLESSGEYVRFLRGEWHVGLRSLVLPTLVNLQDQGYAKDADALLDAHACRIIAQIREFENANGSMARQPTQITQAAMPELSPECRDLFEMSVVGSTGGYQGWIRAQVESSMNAAAFEIMSGRGVPNEPISGRPFTWDANRRVLALPDVPVLSFVKLNPMEVPRLAYRD